MHITNNLYVKYIIYTYVYDIQYICFCLSGMMWDIRGLSEPDLGLRQGLGEQ